MTKKDIVKTIAEQLDLPQLRTKELVQKTFDALIEAIVEEGRVELRNFGVFQLKRRDARVGRNPRTGQRVAVEAKTAVTFKPGKEMEARVRKAEERRGRQFDTSSAGGETADDHTVYAEMDEASDASVYGESETADDPVKHLSVICKHCNATYSLECQQPDYDRWRSGTQPLDEALHYLSAGERELLLSRTCSKCFDRMFPPLDDGDDGDD